MEEIIKRIIQIEEEAAEIEKTVDEKIRQKKTEQDKTLEKLRQVIKGKAASKVDTLRQMEMKTADEEIKKQQEVAQKQMDRLTEIEAAKSAEWVDHLFAEIIKE